jgi:hypothetical protein
MNDLEFSDWLVAKGFDPEDLTADQRAALEASWRAEAAGRDLLTPQTAPAAEPPTVEDAAAKAAAAEMEHLLQQARKENLRVQQITLAVSEALRETPERVAEIEQVGRLAIDGRWTPEQAQLNLMRVTRPRGPIVSASSAPQVTQEVVEAAVCRAAGMRNIEKRYPARVLDAADRHFRGGLGFIDVVNLTARANGMRDADVRRNTRDTLRAAFRVREPWERNTGRRADVGPSTYSLPGILSNLANKFARDAYDFVETEWRRISAIRSVPDFKEVAGYSLTGDFVFKPVAPGGQLQHATAGEESYGNRADTHGVLFAVDRRDIVNDDLGVFSRIGAQLGRGAALQLNQIFWAEFLDDAAFFTAANGNYDDGAETAFGPEGLEHADVLWRSMLTPDGKPLGHDARILLVPSALRIAALRLMNSQQVFEDSARGSENPWAGAYEVVSSRYLTAPKAWYLLADPMDMPVIETCFLNGQEAPTIESVEMATDRLGIVMRGYFDFGVRKQMPKGGLKLKGEA